MSPWLAAFHAILKSARCRASKASPLKVTGAALFAATAVALGTIARAGLFFVCALAATSPADADDATDAASVAHSRRLSKHNMSNRLPRSGNARISSLGSSHEFYKGVQMAFSSVDPATGEKLKDYAEWDTTRLDRALDVAQAAVPRWAALQVGERCKKLRE